MQAINVTASITGDPIPDREERAEALRLSLPEPRPEQPLAEWLDHRQTRALPQPEIHVI